MAGRHAELARARLAVLSVLLTAVLLAGCGSSGVHTQTPTFDPPSSSTRGPTSGPSVTPPSSPTSKLSSPPSTPSGFGDAQPAVMVYLTVISAYDDAFRHPATASTASFGKYLVGQAKVDVDRSLAQARAASIAYRGTPDVPRLKVMSSSLEGSLPEVVLRDCGHASMTDPFVGYQVKTGKPLPTSTPKVPPPYAKTVKMFQPNRKQWVISSVTTDATKTCTP